MKHFTKILVGSLALVLGGISSASIASSVINNQPTTAQKESSNNTLVLKDDTTSNLNTNTVTNQHKFVYTSFYTGEKTVVKSGIDFASMITKGIQKGGTSLAGFAFKTAGKFAFNAIMSSLGIDVKFGKQQALNKIQKQLDGLKTELREGITDVKRTVKQVQHKNIMNDILTKLEIVQSPIAAKMATMIDISNKELDPSYDKKELESEKETFYKGLGDMKFSKLDGINLWNTTENLARSILVPFAPETSLTLTDLYEDCYGANETWDYMTIAPRTKFISYVGTVVNSLANIALVKANYEMSKFKTGDSNLIDYQTGVTNMITAVDKLNAEFKTQLDKLSVIQKKHDEEHLITHRDLVVSKDGDISYKEGRTVSTKLFAITAADNDDNYITYTHDDVTKYRAPGFTGPATINYNYTLDCTANRDLYKTVFEEFQTYKTKSGNKNLTMQEYLLKAGFTCDNKEGFNKASGFYIRSDCSYHDYTKFGGFGSKDNHSDLRAFYVDFKKKNFEESPGEISEVVEYTNGWFGILKYRGAKGDQVNNYYLVFVDKDQKTIGKIKTTEIQRAKENEAGEFYKKHYLGHKKWTGKDNDVVTIK